MVPGEPAHDTEYAPYTRCYCEENVYALLNLLVNPISLRQECSDTAERVTKDDERHYAVFVSNNDHACVLFQQSASTRGPQQLNAVIWDYHVFAVSVLMPPSSSTAMRAETEAVTERHATSSHRATVIVRDADSLLENPTALTRYVNESFRPDLFEQGFLPRNLERIVPATAFLDNFASDRSHMLAEKLHRGASSTAKEYIQPPPAHDPICGRLARQRNEQHNLWTRFLDMRTTAEGGNEDSDQYGVVVDGVRDLLDFEW
ncbi:hypothetical protein OIV83_004553 [Microbotryomycetes sp. JL201]|nr:hypothetical protein OIV83_004553 [Microbotryomycetes sp. JL201]